MPERVHRLRVPGSDEARPCGRVDLPACGTRPERVRAGVDRGPERIPCTANVVRRRRLALVEEVPDALEIAAVAGARDAEVDVEELAASGAQLAGRAVADVLLRACVDGRAVISPPGVAEAAAFDLSVHQVGDLELAQPRAKRSGDDVEDLLGLAGSRANALDLLRRLPPAKCVHDRLGGREALGERCLSEGLLELEPQAVGEAVGCRVAGRVVERDRPRREPLDRLAEGGADALVVTDDLVGADLLDARRVETSDDGDPLAARRHEERALPRAVHARDEVEAGITGERRLADEGQPEVDVVLAEDLRRLAELLLHEGRARSRRHRQDASTVRRQCSRTTSRL